MAWFRARWNTYSPGFVLPSLAQTGLRGRSAALVTVDARLKTAVKERERDSARMLSICRVVAMEISKMEYRGALFVCWLPERTLYSSWLDLHRPRHAKLAIA